METTTILIPYSENNIKELLFTFDSLYTKWKKIKNKSFKILVYLQCLKKDLVPSKEILLLLKDYRDKFKSLNHIDLKFSYQKDVGIYDAINKAIKNILSKYLVICGAGDSIELETLNHFFLSRKDKNSVHIFNTKFRFSKKIVKSPKGYMLAYQNICQQSILYKTKILKKYKFDHICKIQADYLWNLKYLRLFPIQYHSEILGIYNEVDGVSKDKSKIDEQFFEFKTSIIIENYSILIAATEYLYRIIIRIKRFFFK